MADRIDHAAEARTALSSAAEKPADASVVTDPWLLAAQVHATLALVEQKRIANLIAIYSAQGPVESDYEAAGIDFAGVGELIREGLGL